MNSLNKFTETFVSS